MPSAPLRWRAPYSLRIHGRPYVNVRVARSSWSTRMRRSFEGARSRGGGSTSCRHRTRELVKSQILDSRGATRRVRVPDHRSGVRGSHRARAAVAVGGVGRERCCLRRAHLVRALQAGQLNAHNGVARGARSRDRRIRSRSRRDDSFALHHISDSSGVVARTSLVAGIHRDSGVSCHTRGRRAAAASAAERRRSLANHFFFAGRFNRSRMRASSLSDRRCSSMR